MFTKPGLAQDFSPMVWAAPVRPSATVLLRGVPSRAQVSAPAATGDVKPVSSSGKCRFHFFVNEKTEGDF